MLEDVHHKAYIRKNHERLQQEYCFVVTDGKGIIAIDTIGYNVPIRKSRLIPRQEQMVYEMVENVQAEKYEFQVEEMEKEHHILSPSPFIMNGLTRKERQLKQLLFMALDQLHTTKNTAEIRYWFTEWDPSAYGMVQHMEFEDIWAKLYEEAKTGWSEKHEQLCERLVKGQPFLKSYGKWKTSKR